MRKVSEGFTLIEIMIVVAIIAALAALAFPNLLRTRLIATENAVKAELKAFSTANESYRSAQIPPTYSPDIDNLVNPPSGPSYLDRSWSSENRRGYIFDYHVADAPAGTYALFAEPANRGITGNNSFCVDQSSIVIGSTADGAENIPEAGASGCSGGVPIAA